MGVWVEKLFLSLNLTFNVKANVAECVCKCPPPYIYIQIWGI